MKLKTKKFLLNLLLSGSLMMWAIPSLVAQSNPVKVTGQVVDVNGDPLIGVSVVLEGTSSGTITDVSGSFMLQSATLNPVLQISYVGFANQKVVVKNIPVRIVLTETSEQLEEVVVVGYGTQRKKDLTGSVSVIKSDELNSLPVPSVSDAMQGRAAGVQVISSGTPGSDATFRIRGTGTINDSNPLIVIDGIPVSNNDELSSVPEIVGLPVSNGLNQLNMDDIESMQILKDASATAIYGSRGANGVVIITTKRGTGSGGRSNLNFNYSYSLQQPTNLVKMLNASQFAQLQNELLTNGGQVPNPAFVDPESLGTGTNWLGEVFRQAPMQNYSLSYSGNNEKTNYYISGNILNQDGIVINTGFKRFSLQVNADSKVNSWLKIGNSILLNHDLKSRGGYGIRNTMLALPTQPVKRPDGTYSGPLPQTIYNGDLVNPVGLALVVDNLTSGYNLMGSVYAELELMKDLKLKTTYGMQVNFWDTRIWTPSYRWDTSYNNSASLFQQYNKNITWLWDNTLTYDKTIGDHRLGLMVGTSAQENRYNYINASIKQFASETTQQLDNGFEQPANGGNTSSWSLLSYMGRVNYGYADKYLITATVRRDGSSRFGAGNKYGIFPSASAAWRISEEDFMKSNKLFDDMKIRAGYGITGNQEIGNYSFASSLNTYVYNFNNTVVSAVVPVVMPNPYVQWERQKQGNVGVDATILNQRLDITVDAYIKNTDKMLVQMVVPVSSGYSDVTVPSINAGKMQNKGIELTLNSRNLTGELKWNTSFNISFNQNKIISINDTVPLATGSIGLNYNLALIKAGLPINTYYGFVTDGIFQTQEEVDNHAVQVPGNDPYNRTSPGDIRFKDLNNDGVINDDDRTYLGNSNPAVIYAINNTFSYKGFDLSIFMQGIAGSKIVNANRFWSEAMAVSQNQTIATLNRWNGEGSSNTMPRAIFNDPNKNTRPSDRFIEDGSFLRVKNLTLGYTIPKNLIEKINLHSARFYISCQNLFTFTNYSGSDPEVGTNGIVNSDGVDNASGIDNNVYPVTRTVTVGINLGI